MEIMNTNTQNQELELKQLKRWMRAYDLAKELFPELPQESQRTLANCLIEAIFKNK